MTDEVSEEVDIVIDGVVHDTDVPVAAHRGEMLGRLSTRFVGLHKEYYGKGPTSAKVYYVGDLIVVLMRGGFTKAEETLLRDGRGRAVIDQRMQFQEAMADIFRAVVTEETGREVIAVMSSSHQTPDMLAELFVLAPESDPA